MEQDPCRGLDRQGSWSEVGWVRHPWLMDLQKEIKRHKFWEVPLSHKIRRTLSTWSIMQLESIWNKLKLIRKERSGCYRCKAQTALLRTTSISCFNNLTTSPITAGTISAVTILHTAVKAAHVSRWLELSGYQLGLMNNQTCSCLSEFDWQAWSEIHDLVKKIEQLHKKINRYSWAIQYMKGSQHAFE